MSSHDFDLFVIGAGSGGVRAARIAAGHGAKVGIAEEYRFGGTCVIRGCVPKKLFVYASRFGEAFEDARGFGWQVPAVGFDWTTLVANKDKEIERLSQIYRTNLDRAGVRSFESRALLRDPHTIYLAAEDRSVTAKTILVATGGRPFIPEIPGAEHAITSNEAFHLPALPDHIVVVGGGYIAVEFAGIFRGLGVQVTQLYRGEQILRGFDDDMREGVADALRARGVDLRVGAQVKEIFAEGAGYHLMMDDDTVIVTDLVMYATGRVPNTVNLGLEQAGLELGPKGEVPVDEFSRSAVEHIYAVGDVTNRVNLTPVAVHEGHAFADTVYGGQPTPVDHDWIPTAVFSEPEVGTVGLTEAQARERYDSIDIYKSSFKPMVHTLSGRDQKMIMKLIVDGATDRVVGCHIFGPDGGEMAQTLAIAMRMGATKADFDRTMALHPSAAEELVTMREKWVPPSETS